MNSAAYISIILGSCVLWVACSFPVALSCDSCGRECASACGTRHFRTCCFNYLRKRSSPPPEGPMEYDKHLELWHASKPMRQNPPMNRRYLSDLLFKNVDNDMDYQYIPIKGSNHLVLDKFRPTALSISAGETSAHSLETDGIRSMERSSEKSSEESQTGRVPLLYES
ncbi:uncharacterized protein LOC128731352 [Anopheles nili]|uniref:uncharacterized protein LOC128731352 n=1 Tax=Anopheles nili TaxID=185578 RepID=UPI00237AD2D0|nr:uncharacterized protein LOC128731352 [Anopheles nili]